MDEKRADLILRLCEKEAPSLGRGPCKIENGKCARLPHLGRRAGPLGLACAGGIQEAEAVESQGRSYNRMKAVDAIAKEVMDDLWPSTKGAKPGYCLLCGARSTVLDSSQRCPSCSEAKEDIR